MNQATQPNSIQAEQAIIGGLFIDGSKWDVVAEKVSARDFYARSHQTIFSAMEMICSGCGTVDIVTVADALERGGELESIGGMPYLVMLARDTPSAANIAHYASIVKEKSSLRELLYLSNKISAKIASGSLSASEAVNELGEKLSGLYTPSNQLEAQDWKPDLTADIDYVLPAHFGIVADIQHWILSISLKKQPAIALGAALTVMSVILGRELHCDGIKGNIMTICLAESTEGKDFPFKCVKKILTAVGLGHKVQGRVASGAALIDMVYESPSCAMLVDEMGHFLSGINSKTSNQYAREIMPIITEMYTSAAPDDFFLEKRTKGNDPKRIEEPNLSVFGLATEAQIINSVRTSELADGSLPRFFIMFGKKHVEIDGGALDIEDRSPPEYIVEGLKRLMTEHGSSGFSLKPSKKITLTQEYKEHKRKIILELSKYAIERAKQGGNSGMFSPFYGRLAVGAIQMALLIDQCASLEVLDWCVEIRKKSIDVFEKKYAHTGYDNENERQVKMVEAVIKEAGKRGATLKDIRLKTRQVETRARKNMLDDLVESGLVFTEQKRVNGSQKPSTFYFWKK